MKTHKRFDVKYVTNGCVVYRALLMAAIVGTILVVINHGMCLYTGNFGLICMLQTGLTFMVPYVVSTVSSVLAMSDPRYQACHDSPSSPD